MEKDMSTIRTTAMNMVLKCGIPPSLKGCAYLSEAIEMYALNEYSFTDIYRTIGKRNGISAKSVMRNISYAISQGFDVGNKLSAIVGVDIPDAQIHSSLVISYLAHILKPPTRD